MRYLLVMLLASFVSSTALAAPEKVSQFPPAATLTGNEGVPIVQGSQSVRTTTGAIAALTGGGSTGAPGGMSTQIQYNNGGVFGGLSTILYVQAFGAKCDGHIIQTGLVTTANSTDIYIINGEYLFTAADVGATITITYPGAANTYFQQNTLTTTIASVNTGNGHAQLTVAPTFTTGPNAQYPAGSGRWYHTDDSVAIQNAFNAGAALPIMGSNAKVGGGNIRLPSGVCVAKNLEIYANQELSGESGAASWLMLPANANTNILTSYNFYGTESAANQYEADGVRLYDLSFDGNRGANTSAGIGTFNGTGLVRLRGNNKVLENVRFNFSAGDGLFTAGGSNGGTPFYTNNGIGGSAAAGLGYAEGFEDHMNNVYGFYNAGWGVVDDGAGDSEITNMWLSGNNTGGLLNQSTSFSYPIANGSPLHVQNYHAYQNAGGLDIDIETASFRCEDCDLEDGGTINAPATFINSDSRSSGTFHIGKTGSSGINGSNFINSQIANLNIASGAVANNGAADVWINSLVTNITGNTYRPNNIFMSSGFGYQSINVGSGGYGAFQLANCPGGTGACTGFTQQNTSSAGAFTLGTGTSNASIITGMSMDASQNVAFGPGANNSGASAGANVDFHFSTGSEVLPSGTLAQRPACVGAIAGGIRFDITTGNVELCAGNGSWTTFGTGTVSLSTPNQFTAGQSVLPVTVPINTVVHYTPNLQLGNNFVVTLSHSACPCTLDSPANMIPGQSGWITVIQSGSGSDTIGTYGSFYKFSGGTPPTLSTGANAVDVLSYTTLSTTQILINPSLNFH